MHLIMFDIDGTLIESNDFDSICFSRAVNDVLNITVDTNWKRYKHVSDLGILRQLIAESTDLQINDSIVDSVKERFLMHLNLHMENTKIEQIPGASNFVEYLQSRPDVTVSLATGGWYESAQLKLNAAGVNSTNIPIASSSDHYSRTEIMKISERLTQEDTFQSKTYFGDGVWDLDASKLLNYGFVLVGDRVDWEPSVENYSDISGILNHIGL